jgi:HAD superfamily hydrolase (TIGR01490 family)
VTAAFFDVDETLLNAKSLFEFLRFWQARQGDDGRAHDRVMTQVRDLAAAGTDRAVINRVLFRPYRGASPDELAAAGEDWYRSVRSRPAGFVRSGLDALARHRSAGHTVVLVSGSAAACLAPLARDLGADLVICTEPVVGADGRLTGEVVVPMIGEAKRRAVEEVLAGRGLDRSQCHAYGDHASDLGMLTAVGHAYAIGSDAPLLAHARARGWPVLSARPGPLRTSRP